MLNHAIRFRAADNTPHLTVADLVATITNDHYPMTSIIPFTIYSQSLTLESYSIEDDNNHNHRVDPNEVDTLHVWFKNTGIDTITDLMFEMRISDAYIYPLDIRDDFYLLAPGETRMAEFVFRTDPQFEPFSVMDVLIDVYNGFQYSETKVISLVGESNCESFENGLPDYFSYADTAWYMTTGQVSDGLYSLCSGNISHNDTSTLICHFTALREGNVSFNFKTSTENNYDWFYFYIDGVMQSRWSGLHDWDFYSAPVLAGEHTLTWKYIKDYSVDGNSDKVWIDNVCFPLENDATPELRITPDVISLTAGPEAQTIPLLYESVSPIFLLYESCIVNEDHNPVGWASIDYPVGSLNALESRQVNLSLTMGGLPDGVYHAYLMATVEEGNEVTVPISVIASGTGVNEYVAEGVTVKVYPNPTTGHVTVDQEGVADGQTVQCRLFDVSGRQVGACQKEASRFELDLDGFAPGFYFLHINRQDGTTQVVKIVKR